MSSTIFTAPAYDPRREKRKKYIAAGIVVGLLIIAALIYEFRNWSEEHITSRFFTALVNKDYKAAYGIWQHDPAWETHPDKYPRYSFNDFYQDWGPGGEWGLIRNFHIDGSTRPSGGSGVIVQVTINDRKEPARIWVEKSSKQLTFSPY